MITDFELQKGDGISVEILGGDDVNGFWLVADEDDLVKMVRIAFDCPKFTINHLIDGLMAACEQAPGGGVSASHELRGPIGPTLSEGTPLGTAASD